MRRESTALVTARKAGLWQNAVCVCLCVCLFVCFLCERACVQILSHAHNDKNEQAGEKKRNMMRATMLTSSTHLRCTASALG